MSLRIFYRLPAVITLSVLLSGCASTVLLHASSEGDTQQVLTQLANGVDPNSTIPVLGTPAIVLAAAEGHLETVRTLIGRGADVNAEDSAGWTALHAATRNGHKDIVVLLLDHGARIKPATWYNPTPMYVAEKRGHPDILELLKAADRSRRATDDVRRTASNAESKTYP